MSTDDKPMPRAPVVIFTHTLLDPSMTFILSHGEALRGHEALYVGSHRAKDGLQTPAGRSWAVNSGGAKGKVDELLFRRFHRWPPSLDSLKDREPALVHAHFGTSAPAALTIADRLGVPLVVTFHGKDATITRDAAASSRRGREYLRRIDEVIERSEVVIAVSDFIRDRVLAQGFPSGRVLTHRNGIDTGFFTPGPYPREPVIVFVGRFVEKKGVDVLLAASGILRSQGVAARTVLIGDGPLRPDLERAVRVNELDVEFTGFLPLAEVRGWLGRAAVVAVPSVTASDGDSEGLPTIVLEAQASATPVVATRHSGIPEGVIEGETALLVPERDAAALASAIASVLGNRQLAEEMGRAGRAFVTKEFSLPGQVSKLESIYRDVRSRARSRD